MGTSLLHVSGVVSSASFGLTALTSFVRWRFPKIPHYISGPGIAIGAGIFIMSFIPGLKIGTWISALGGLALLAFSVEWQLATPTKAAPQKTSAPSPAPATQRPLGHGSATPDEPKPHVAHQDQPEPPHPANAPVIVNNSPGSLIAPSGGTNTVNNYGPPPPSVQILSDVQFVGKAASDAFQWAYTFRVVGAPEGVTVAVRAGSIKDASVNPIDQGTVQYGTRPVSDGMDLILSSPRGRYQVVINTLGDSSPKIETLISP